MGIADIDWGQAIQGSCGLVALYLALQIKNRLANHETRITTLEYDVSPKPVSRRRHRSSR
jgi:hypothetical protein